MDWDLGYLLIRYDFALSFPVDISMRFCANRCGHGSDNSFEHDSRDRCRRSVACLVSIARRLEVQKETDDEDGG